MGKSKRDSSSVDYDEPSKRPRHNAPQKEGTQGRIDPTYGQRSAFPGLDGEGGFAEEDDDLDYGDDAGAMSYLRSVRSEAAGIPTVIVAPKPIMEGADEEDRTIYEDGVGDSRGFYSDGAYTAAPDPQPDTPADILPAKHRTTYFKKTLERFERLREQLRNTPPDHIVEQLDQNHDSYMSASAADYRKWRWRVTNTEPMNAQLARMDRATSLKLLRLLTNDKLTMGGNTIPSERLSRWIWGVLARLPDSGELNSEEIGLVRDLGKRAVWLGVVMNQPPSDTAAVVPGEEDIDEEDYEDDEEEEGEVGNEVSVPKPEENDKQEVEDGKDMDAQGSRANVPAVPKDRTWLYDLPTTEEEVKRHEQVENAVRFSFWDGIPAHIWNQFSFDINAPRVTYEGHLPDPEIMNILIEEKDDETKFSAAMERLRNFFKRNRGFARYMLRVVYKRNPWAEQYDGPVPPTIGDGWMDFVREHPEYKLAIYGPSEDEGPRDTADDEYGDEAFDRAWLVARLDDPQTRIYDDGRDEEEEIALEKLGLVAGRVPCTAIVEETQPEAEKDEEETLQAARDRILAQLGEAEDTNAVELERAREALKEQELKDQARADEEDAARRLNAKATIDMIITVAGEVYGQRDLLEFRETWD
ncbi:hypothetical protein O988_00285 [Pseudogymnoascus sp. VKM F-3808]|nr:hypothetical protein O988_00285 [Pseudogymnoascus sp. VKM F-3808]